MKNIENRIKRIEEKVVDKNKIPVLIVDKNIDDTYTHNGNIYTKAKLDIFCAEHKVGTVFINDLNAWED